MEPVGNEKHTSLQYNSIDDCCEKSYDSDLMACTINHLKMVSNTDDSKPVCLPWSATFIL